MGKYEEVQTRIHNLQPKTIYTHCTSYQLNLTLLMLTHKKLFLTVKKVSNFVCVSPKRVDLFKKILTEKLSSSKSIIFFF